MVGLSATIQKLPKRLGILWNKGWKFWKNPQIYHSLSIYLLIFYPWILTFWEEIKGKCCHDSTLDSNNLICYIYVVWFSVDTYHVKQVCTNMLSKLSQLKIIQIWCTWTQMKAITKLYNSYFMQFWRFCNCSGAIIILFYWSI